MYASRDSMTALIAGHKPSDVRTVRDLLSRRGITRIETVADGGAAIGAMSKALPDLLVLDWDIQGSDAEAVVSAAREQGAAQPRILVTIATPTRAAIEAAKELRIDSIVAAPFSPRAFLDRMPRLERVRS